MLKPSPKQSPQPAVPVFKPKKDVSWPPKTDQKYPL